MHVQGGMGAYVHRGMCVRVHGVCVPMCIDVYVCIFMVYVYAHVHGGHVCACVPACICVHMCMCLVRRVCICTWGGVSMHVGCVCVCVGVYVHLSSKGPRGPEEGDHHRDVLTQVPCL